MARISESVKNYTTAGKGVCKNINSIEDEIEHILDTLSSIRYSMKKKWGYGWYEDARYGFYESARSVVIAQKPCFSKTVALQGIDDLEKLRGILDAMREEARKFKKGVARY